MEGPLKCNNTSCRAELRDRAVVTTCSHIFCLRCTDSTGLSRSSEAQRTCPACRTSLPNPDDAVNTVLQPTEDYKTSVLSGLSPSIIMECTGRALAFWTYQSAMEIEYQVHLGKHLTDRYSHLSSELDKIVHSANSQIQDLQAKIGALTIDQKTVHQKNNELVEMYREKSKKHAQTQHLYDTLKKRILMSQVGTVASDNVNQTLRSISNVGRPATYNDTDISHLIGNAPHYRQPHSVPVDENGVEQLHRHQRNGIGSQTSADAAAMPPPDKVPNRDSTSTTPLHRTQLLGTRRPLVPRSQIPLITRTNRPTGDLRAPGSAVRHSLGSSSFHRNSQGSSTGFGISGHAGRETNSDWVRQFRNET